MRRKHSNSSSHVAKQAGAASIGSGRYGDKNPACPLGQFYDTQTARVPTCKACVGFAWNLDKSMACYPPQADPVQKSFCGAHFIE
jgi:hypothetical protein